MKVPATLVKLCVKQQTGIKSHGIMRTKSPSELESQRTRDWARHSCCILVWNERIGTDKQTSKNTQDQLGVSPEIVVWTWLRNNELVTKWIPYIPYKLPISVEGVALLLRSVERSSWDSVVIRQTRSTWQVWIWGHCKDMCTPMYYLPLSDLHRSTLRSEVSTCNT